MDDAPIASGETVNSQEDQSVTLTSAALLANETDVDNATSSLHISRVASSTGGTATLQGNGDVVFTPFANYNGVASFTYWVKDPLGLESNPATVTLNVAPVNDTPFAQGEVVNGASEDAVFTIPKLVLLANDGDVEDSVSSLNIVLVGSPSNGTVSLDGGGNVVYTPSANFNGLMTFQYQVADSQGALSPVVTAQVPVAAVNDNPVGVDDLFAMYTNTAASPSHLTIGFNQLLSNDSDVDNPNTDLTVTAVRNASNGTVSIVGGAVSFTPAQDFTGRGYFQYQVDDQHGGTAWATAYVDTSPPPNMYPSINVTYANFYPTGSTPAAAFDIGQLSFSAVDDGNTSLVSITYVGGSYHVFGNPGGAVSSLPWNIFTYNQNSWYIDIPRSDAVDSFDTTWTLVDDRGLQNTWHFGYTVGVGYRNSMDFSGYAPPIVVSLDGNAPHYIETHNSNVRFDLNGDGVADQVAWAAPGSGVLAIDLNGDHKISNASEFTFTQYVPGAKTDLQGLVAFDTNHNGVLDAGDAKWGQFGVWEDKNSDGVSQDGEFKTLDQLGITSIDLTSHTPTHAQPTPADGHLTGVAVVGQTILTRTDGSTAEVDDAMLAFTSPISSGTVPANPTASMATMGAHVHTPVIDTTLQTDAADVVRMALLFNQYSNTAIDSGHAPLGYVPIQTDGHWQDAAPVLPTNVVHEPMHIA